MNPNIVVLNKTLPISRQLAQSFFDSMNKELSTSIDDNWLNKIFKNATIVAAVDNDSIQGWVVFYANDFIDYTSYVAGLHILKPFRGKGISKLLMLKAIEVAKTVGMRKITLYCKTDNIAALVLYSKLGFEESCREIKTEYANQEYAYMFLEIM